MSSLVILSPSLTITCISGVPGLVTMVMFLLVSSPVTPAAASAATRNPTASTMATSKRLTMPSSGSPLRSAVPILRRRM